MIHQPPPRARVGRRAALIGSLSALAGCAFKPVALDPSAMAGIHRLNLPTPGFPTSPTVDVTAGIGKGFGLIGLVSTGIVTLNRASALSALMAAQGFDPRGYFTASLTAALQTLRLGITPQDAPATRSDFVKDYAAPPGTDAILDVYVASYGLVAYSDSDDSPYRPAISLGTRLVGAQDRSVLMQDMLANLGIGAGTGPAPSNAPASNAPASNAPTSNAPTSNAPAFTTFSDATNNPARAVEAIKFAIDFAAASIKARLA